MHFAIKRDSGANMGEVIRFIPKSERERVRLIREARAIYDSIFPSEPVIGPEPASASHAAAGVTAYRRDGAVLP
jgi:hypothetical protein